MEDLKVMKRDYFMVPVSLIDVVWEEDYSAPDRGDIQGLANSIRVNGFRKNDPVLCSRDGERFHLHEGFRRMWAVLKIVNAEAPAAERIERIPVIIAERYANDGDHKISQILENSHRADATAIEKADAYRQLVEYGLEVKEIAHRLAETPAAIERHLLLLQGSGKIRKALQTGTIGVTAAAEIIKKSANEEQQNAGLEAAVQASGGEKATTASVKKTQPRVRAPYRTTRKLKEVETAIKHVRSVIELKAYKTDDELEPAKWQGYRDALAWMNGGEPPWA